MAEYYHTLLENGGRLLKDGEVVHETDYQILGHKNNEAQTPPEKKNGSDGRRHRAFRIRLLSVCLKVLRPNKQEFRRKS